MSKMSQSGHGGCSRCAEPLTLARVWCLYASESSESWNLLSAEGSQTLGSGNAAVCEQQRLIGLRLIGGASDLAPPCERGDLRLIKGSTLVRG